MFCYHDAKVGKYMGIMGDVVDMDMYTTSVSRVAKTDDTDAVQEFVEKNQAAHSQSISNMTTAVVGKHSVQMPSNLISKSPKVATASRNAVNTMMRDLIKRNLDSRRLDESLLPADEEEVVSNKKVPLWSKKVKVQKKKLATAAKLKISQDEFETSMVLFDADYYFETTDLEFDGKD